MNVVPIKTHKVAAKDTLFSILDTFVETPAERSVIAITSKIVSITEGRAVPVGSVSKDELIRQEASHYLPRTRSRYGVSFTITENILVPNAGIDESNGNGHFILWPKNVQQTANDVRRYMRQSRGIKELGIIITDSKTTPLRWGVTGLTIGYSGFAPLKDYIGTPDIFGRLFEYEKLSIIDSLASAAVLVMGEGDEQMPLAVISDIPFIEFRDNDPTAEELQSLRIHPKDDLYAPFLEKADWEKGK